MEHRSAEGRNERFPDLAAELVGLKVDVIVTRGHQRSCRPSRRPARSRSSWRPVVDPVAAALVSSLARPGGNITGLTRCGTGSNGKRLELLKEAVPQLSRVAVLGMRAPGHARRTFRRRRSLRRT